MQQHTHKVLLRQQKEVTVRCPKCGDSKTLAMEKYGKERWLRIICACKFAFDVEFEHRNRFRKQTALSGYMERVGSRIHNTDRLAKVRWETQSILRPNCTIVNLSVDGIGIRAGGSHGIRKDDILKVRFLLDDSVGTIIEKLYLVVSVQNDYLGCRNHQPDQQDQKLGFYVLS
ncbi:PilZ domain-containing protein [Thiovibrio sp. JS02]